MNYYPHHIGDYDSHTAHLTWAEDMAYRRLICLYYRTEKPLPVRPDDVYRLVRAQSSAEKKAVLQVLNEFFVRCTDGWRNSRCDDEIAKAQAKAEKNREIGKKGGRPKKLVTEPVNSEHQKITQTVSGNNPEETQMVSKNNPNITLPITNNQEPITKEITTAAYSPVVELAEDSSPLPAISSENSKSEEKQGFPERNVQIAVLIRKWEKSRGKLAKVMSSTPHLQTWVEKGVTDSQLREAYDLAVSDRESKGDNTAINAGFLDAFLARLLNPPEATSALNRPIGAAVPWQASWSGIEAKGRELGIHQSESEHPQAYKARVFEAAQMTAQERSTLRADFGVSV